MYPPIVDHEMLRPNTSRTNLLRCFVSVYLICRSEQLDVVWHGWKLGVTKKMDMLKDRLEQHTGKSCDMCLLWTWVTNTRCFKWYHFGEVWWRSMWPVLEAGNWLFDKWEEPIWMGWVIGGGYKHIFLSQTLGKWSNLTNTFGMDCRNHQLSSLGEFDFATRHKIIYPMDSQHYCMGITWNLS